MKPLDSDELEAVKGGNFGSLALMLLRSFGESLQGYGYGGYNGSSYGYGNYANNGYGYGNAGYGYGYGYGYGNAGYGNAGYGNAGYGYGNAGYGNAGYGYRQPYGYGPQMNPV